MLDLVKPGKIVYLVEQQAEQNEEGLNWREYTGRIS
jgi:hypothetical protein